MINEADVFLQNLRNKAQDILVANIDSEINYIFTNDETYLAERTKLIPTQPKNSGGGVRRNDGSPLMDAQATGEQKPISASRDTKDERDRLKK